MIDVLAPEVEKAAKIIGMKRKYVVDGLERFSNDATRTIFKDAEKMRWWHSMICFGCGKSLGEHRACELNCPSKDRKKAVYFGMYEKRRFL